MTELEFSDFFNLHWSNVFALALKLCNEEEVAKDICQNIFSSVWSRGLRYDNDGAAAAYLVKATKFQVLNYFRDAKQNEQLSEQHFQNNTDQLRYNPETLFFDKELSKQLDKHIARLKEPSRTIFKLSRENNLSYREIAAEQGVAVKTVEKHISIALRQLRSVFSPS